MYEFRQPRSVTHPPPIPRWGNKTIEVLDVGKLTFLEPVHTPICELAAHVWKIYTKKEVLPDPPQFFFKLVSWDPHKRLVVVSIKNSMATYV